MDYWKSVQTAAEMNGAFHWVILGIFAGIFILRAFVPQAGGRLRVAALLTIFSVVAVLICGGLLDGGTPADQPFYRWVHFAAQLCLAIAVIDLAGVLLFRVVLVGLHLKSPPILRDTLLGVAYIVVSLMLLGRHGVNLTGIVATSAVVTAVIGFSLQDTLGNIMGGAALQLEQSIRVGDWIRLGDVEGVVHEIRWRQTSIQTRGWDTIVIPNSVLMKSQVMVLGRRAGQPRQHRMLVTFNVDYRHSPLEVIDAVNQVLRRETIPNVAVDPAPTCILKDFLDSYASYIAAYWLVDISRTESTSSEVRTRIFVALQRAGIAMSIPAQSVFMTLENRQRETQKLQKEMARRLTAMEKVTILQALNIDERRALAEHLTVAPFRAGEVITRQGDPGSHLYMLIKGEAQVQIQSNGVAVKVSTLAPGDVFGEMALVTGKPRSATVTAVSNLVCYRLDQENFAEALRQRPSLAEDIAKLLTRRRTELEAASAGLGEKAGAVGGGDAGDLLGRIRGFFRLG